MLQQPREYSWIVPNGTKYKGNFVGMTQVLVLSQQSQQFVPAALPNIELCLIEDALAHAMPLFAFANIES